MMEGNLARTYRILFTGVGRRVELVQSFRSAADSIGVHLKIYGADMNETAPALAFCDYTRKVCGMRDADYVFQLMRICEEDKIDLLIPTIDTDLLVLSQNAPKYDKIGTKVLISKPDKIAICRDKNYTADYFESCGLKAPRTVNDFRRYDAGFPCFIKPKDGSSSINAYKINSKTELEVYANQIGDYVIQPFIEGTEYTVDIFCDFNGKPLYITPRIRLAIRSGEVLKTQISMDRKIIEECRKLIDAFQPCGPITVQLIRQASTDDDYFIEINPRYGGGAPLSMKAGAMSAESVLKIMAGQPTDYSEQVDDGAVYSRFDQSVCVLKGHRNRPLKGVIFDLDDTLYSEEQYVKSGFKQIGNFLGDPSLANTLWIYFKAGQPAIDKLVNELGCPEKKEECLKAYRESFPEITLYDGALELISKLKAQGIKVGIITDGRVSGQRKKIQALGLDEIVDDIIITDELGGEQFRKPCDLAFRIMQRRWGIPFEQMMYVGDNLEKDFRGPQVLGMQMLWFCNSGGLYNQSQKDAFAFKQTSFDGIRRQIENSILPLGD